MTVEQKIIKNKLGRDYPLKLYKYATPPKKFANIAKKVL